VLVHRHGQLDTLEPARLERLEDGREGLLEPAAVSAGSNPYIAISYGEDPLPTPTSSLPWLSWSSMAISSASRIGSYSGTTNVVGASRMRSVTRAAAATNTAGDGASPSGVPWCSARW
jgi:hypothetical protein